MEPVQVQVTDPYSPSVAKDGISHPTCSVKRLPFELLLLIFKCSDRELKPRIRLGLVCRQWRAIVIFTSSLWTKVEVNYVYPSSSGPEMFDKYLARIRLQHDRAANELLDVHWAITGYGDHDARMLQLLNEKDSFRRWRTVELCFDEERTPWYQESNYPNLTFPNLESLEVISRCLHPVMGVIDRTTTSKLQSIRMDAKDLSPYAVDRYCQNMVNHVSHYSVRVYIYTAMPPNVTSVVAAGAKIAHSNNVKAYRLLDCSFQTVTLLHLTKLTVINMINVENSCAVSLPALRDLDCMIVTLRGSATFDTPILEKLRLSYGRDMAAKMVIGGMRLYRDATDQDRMSRDCLYIPLTRGELIIDTDWEIKKLIKFLEWSPYAQRISLSMRDENDVRELLSYFLERQYPREGSGITELKIRGPYESHDLKSMTGLAKKVVARQKEELGVTMVVYGYVWDKDRSYAPLV